MDAPLPEILGIGCPPGIECCKLRGELEERTRNILATIILRDDEGKLRAQAKYTITDSFMLYGRNEMPEGLYSWYPKYIGGDISEAQKKQEMQKNFQRLLQDFVCNHAHAHLVLSHLVEDRPLEEKFTLTLTSDDLPKFAQVGRKMPDEQDFMKRIRTLVDLGYSEFAWQVFAPHIALFYNVTNKTAENFLAQLHQKELVILSTRAGFHHPYGHSGGHSDASALSGLGKRAIQPSEPSGRSIVANEINIHSSGRSIVAIGQDVTNNQSFTEVVEVLQSFLEEVEKNPNLASDDKTSLKADVATIEAQLTKPKPSKAVVSAAIASIKGIVTTEGLLQFVDRIQAIPNHFGIL